MSARWTHAPPELSEPAIANIRFIIPTLNCRLSTLSDTLDDWRICGSDVSSRCDYRHSPTSLNYVYFNLNRLSRIQAGSDLVSQKISLI